MDFGLELRPPIETTRITGHWKPMSGKCVRIQGRCSDQSGRLFRLSGRYKAARAPVSKRLPAWKLGMAGPRLGLVRWLLFLLDLLSLLFVALLEMLRLLLVALLYLLFPGVI